MAVQQEGIVNGKVTDSEGNPVAGATVLIEGTATGAITDGDGNYSFSAPQGAILEVSTVGYVTQTVNIGNQTTVNIQLESDALAVDDVVVVGYGTMEKREVTSSITSVKNKDLIPGSSSSPLMAMQGKVTGLSMVSSAGSDPNATVSLQLRGANSVNASQGPLVVVDGVPGGNIDNIPREDILSIDILKDASAAAIYGTRASGGVILVTTKQAHAGQMSVTYTTELSTESIRKKAETLNAEQYIDLFGDAVDYGWGCDTDWFDAVTRTPFNHRHNLAMSGGTEKFSTYTSINYLGAEGVAIGSDRQEFSGRFNFNYKTLDDRLEFIGSVSYSQAKINNTDTDIFDQALLNEPTIPIYDPDDITGYYVYTYGYEQYNPVAHIALREDKDYQRRLQASLTAKLHITDKLYTSVMVATKDNTDNGVYWESKEHRDSRANGVNGYAYQEFSSYNDATVDWLINYNNKWGKHSLGAMAGYSFQEFNGYGFYMSNSDFAVDGVSWNDMSSGSFLTEGSASMDSWKDPRTRLIAFFGRANYSYDDRFMVTATARYEGSSKFADGNKWGLFPAVSAGWRISSEKFMEDNDWVSELRVRAGWGRTGNEGFESGVSTRMYSADTYWYSNGSWYNTYGLSSNVNEDLVWEIKDEWNLGVDFGFFKNRLTGKLDVYKRISDNLIYDITVSQPPAVHSSTTMNVGTMTNKGWEFELTGVAIDKRDFNYTTTVRFSSNINTLESLWGSQTYYDTYGFPAPGSPGNAVRLESGQRIGQFYIYEHAGIDDDGNFLIYNADGDIIDADESSAADKKQMGNAIPKLMMSWDNSFSYKNFDLSLFFRAWVGYDVFNMQNMYYGLANVSGQNVLTSAINENAAITDDKVLSSYWLERGDFLKLDALTLGYKINTTKFKKYISSARAYMTVRDVFCLTGYSGMDPEVNINGLTPGFETLYFYPETRTWLLGLQITF